MYNEINNLFSTKSFLREVVDNLKKQPLKSFYTTFIPKILRKKIDVLADISQQNKVAENWDVLLDYQKKHNISFQIKPKKEFENSKIIWQYWGQGWDFEKLPDIVQLCHNSIEKHKGDYQVIRLDDNSIHDYLDIPEFVLDKRGNSEFKLVFFSDLLRLMLLTTYGGVWLDATVLLTDKIPLEVEKSDFFIFHREKKDNQSGWEMLNEKYFSWNPNHRVKMLSSIMAVKKDNKQINQLLNSMLLFWQTQNSIPHYFFFQILFDEFTKQNSTEKWFVSMDDTLPHLLQRIFNTPFEQKIYDEIINKVSLHKLTYFENKNNGTYYSYLRDVFK